jgi:hypothetical protein
MPVSLTSMSMPVSSIKISVSSRLYTLGEETVLLSR